MDQLNSTDSATEATT